MAEYIMDGSGESLLRIFPKWHTYTGSAAETESNDGAGTYTLSGPASFIPNKKCFSYKNSIVA